MQQTNKSVLIAYFSRPGNNYAGGGIVDLKVGNTETAADIIAALTGGGLCRIETEKEYSADYHKCTEEAKAELTVNARPALKSALPDTATFDTLFIGYPNWWGTMPMAVCAFLESLDLSGKTILAFCTHEGSGMGRSESDLQRLCPGARLLPGLAIRGSDAKVSEKSLAKWIADSLGKDVIK